MPAFAPVAGIRPARAYFNQAWSFGNRPGSRGSTFAGGGPLRAKAIFYIRAPWPVGDADRAVEAADRVAELSDTMLTNFFCAEVYWRVDRKQDAVAAWRRTIEAPAGDFALAAPFVREFARHALDLADE